MSFDLTELLPTFFEECAEHLDAMEQGLLGLEQAPEAETINTIFRGAHSIKGGAATFGMNEVTSLTHQMETLLDWMRAGKRSISGPDVSLLLGSVDVVRGMLDALRAGETVDIEAAAAQEARVVASLESAPGAVAQPAKQDVSKPVAGAATISDDDFEALLDQLHGKGAAPGAKAPGSNASELSWRVTFSLNTEGAQTNSTPAQSAERILSELRRLGSANVTSEPASGASVHVWKLELQGATREQIEEVFAWVSAEVTIEAAAHAADENSTTPNKPQAAPCAAPSAAPAKSAAPASADAGTIRVSIEKIDKLINMVGELVITQSMLGEIGEHFNMEQLPALRAGLSQLERHTRELQEDVMRVRMLPVSHAFQRLPRLVRDTAGKLGKKIELITLGEQTEMDKTVMEKLADPLVHLVRNSVDHGVEMPNARVAKGKPETGRITLNAFHRSGNVVVEISDDGAGLNRDRILRKARERGLVGADEQIADNKVYELICLPGFSTAEQVSDLSGRGVGMDVVARNLKSLGGWLDIESREGQGTTMRIRLPLTLAILDGQSVRVGGESYIVPIVSIVETIQVSDEKVNTLMGGQEVFRLRDEYLPLVRLHRIFHIEPCSRKLSDGLVVVVEGDGRRIGIFVDELSNQQQIVIKSLETNYGRIEGVSGATILGDGAVALILDVPGLIRLGARDSLAQRAA